VDADLLEAEAWYEQQEAGLGREFLRAARETMDSLPTNPLIHQVRSHRKQVRLGLPAPVSLPHHLPATRWSYMLSFMRRATTATGNDAYET
jgi:hypothetical protein